MTDIKKKYEQLVHELSALLVVPEASIYAANHRFLLQYEAGVIPAKLSSAAMSIPQRVLFGLKKPTNVAYEISFMVDKTWGRTRYEYPCGSCVYVYWRRALLKDPPAPTFSVIHNKAIDGIDTAAIQNIQVTPERLVRFVPGIRKLRTSCVYYDAVEQRWTYSNYKLLSVLWIHDVFRALPLRFGFKFHQIFKQDGRRNLGPQWFFSHRDWKVYVCQSYQRELPRNYERDAC